MARVARALFAPIVAALISCHSGSAQVAATTSAKAPPIDPRAETLKVATGSARRSTDAPKSHARIDIVAGHVMAGSAPGDDGRDPTREPIAASYDLPAFSIDALPYPNEPAVAATTNVSRREAATMCEARGERLCTELEWERACRGPGNDPFSTGAAWDPTCTTNPESCASGFGVRGMATSSQEWTASDVAADDEARDGGRNDAARKLAVVRGASASGAPGPHRCAARHGVDASAKGPIGFRCCSGADATREPVMPAIATLPAFRRTSLAAEGVKLGELFASIPELSKIRGNPRLFQESELHEVTDKAKHPGEVPSLTVDPIVWSPEPGTQLLVVAGRSKGGDFVVALHMLPGGTFRLASSLLFVNEQGPIALSYQSNLHREIEWSMCWGCAGEGGGVTYRDDHRVVIVQR